jgi:hypothetical protein
MSDTNWEQATRALNKRIAFNQEQQRMRWKYTVIALVLFLLGSFAGYQYATAKCDMHSMATTK